MERLTESEKEIINKIWIQIGKDAIEGRSIYDSIKDIYPDWEPEDD